MNPKTVKKALKDAIQAMTDYKWLFSARPGKDNTRNRKFPFQKVRPDVKFCVSDFRQSQEWRWKAGRILT